MIQQQRKRTNKWLEDRMYELWENYFVDIPRKNVVIIKFGRRSSRQLGSIKWANNHTRIRTVLKRKTVQEAAEAQDDKRVTVITITRKFMNSSIPEFVVDATIAHELVHYAHGFSSPLDQQYRHPHKGGLIRKELGSRGLRQLYADSQAWIKTHWQEYVQR